MLFEIINKKTGKVININELKDSYLINRRLVDENLDFAITQEGTILIIDSCGNYIILDNEEYEVKI